MSTCVVHQVFRRLWTDDRGLVLSAELIIIVTMVVLGLITGLACLQQAVVGELQEVGYAIRGMNQSYATTGFLGCQKIWGRTSFTAGSRYTDVANGFGAGGATGFSEIGLGRGGLLIESAPSRVEVTEGCTTCPPPAALPAAPVPSTDNPCIECTPSTRPMTPRPEIPQGPAPQVLPQL